MSQHHTRIKNDPRWKAARAACLERDEHRCQWPSCGISAEDAGRPLEAHHIEDLASNADLAFEVENLVTLCREHHIEAGRETTGLTRLTWVEPSYIDTLGPLLGAGS